MRELNIGSLGGLHYELYDLSPSRRRITEIMQYPADTPAFLDLNGFFWSQLLSPKMLRQLLGELIASVYLHGIIPDAFQAAIQQPDAFIRRVLDAESGIFEQAQSEQDFFGHIETLAVVCEIYAFLHGRGFELTIQEGYLLESHSSVQMLQDCLNENKNPYLPFLKEHAWPALLKYRPECVWLNGRLTLANIAVARFLRREFPSIKLFWVGEGSEYYAANKITQYLRYNIPLFDVIDGIVLFDCEETRRHLSACLERNENIDSIPNLLYVDRSGADIQIMQTPYRWLSSPSTPIVVQRMSCDDTKRRISPEELANIHLFPNQTCFWRKCAFCGINAKYPMPLCNTSLETIWPVEEALTCLQNLELSGIRYFWSIDEAIPAETLLALAEGLSQCGSTLKWQARTRFSPKLPKIAEALAAGGLRELRIGLESASLRVLTRMNKFGPEFSLSLVEKTIAAFQRVDIRVHCPIIIGFPLETDADRKRTYEFLAYLRKNYCNFSFNINIFALDIASSAFSDWDSYGVSSVAFPCAPRYFLGNLVRWNSEEVPFDEKALQAEQNKVMRELLYPWLPENSRISPHILYRLTETTRNTLFRKIGCPKETFKLQVSKWTIPLPAEGGLRKYYSLKVQSCLVVDQTLDAFFSFASSPRTYSELSSCLITYDRIDAEFAVRFIAKLLDYGILERVAGLIRN